MTEWHHWKGRTCLGTTLVQLSCAACNAWSTLFTTFCSFYLGNIRMLVEVTGRQQRPINSLLIKWYGSNISNKIAGILAKSTFVVAKVIFWWAFLTYTKPRFSVTNTTCLCMVTSYYQLLPCSDKFVQSIIVAVSQTWLSVQKLCSQCFAMGVLTCSMPSWSV